MKLSDAIAGIDGAVLTGDAAVDVTGIAIDSRSVRPGDLFVAIAGTRVDGHGFISDAIAGGAVAVVVERESVLPTVVPVVIAPDTRRAAAALAATLSGGAAGRLSLYGSTGTNGKTSVSWMLRSILARAAGSPVGLVGTLGWGGRRLNPATLTTPDAVSLHRIFAELEEEGCVGVVMEVSSHAVRQHRTWGLNFNVGILTNVTHDHLDYHSGFSDYRDAKESFCRSVVDAEGGAGGTLVYWRDDPVAREIGESFADRAVSVGTGKNADTQVDCSHRALDGTGVHLQLFDGESVDIRTKMAGAFVDTNVALAATAARVAGASPEDIRLGVEGLGGIPGRFETFGGRGTPVVVVDYAHTPDALEKTLTQCRALGGRRVVVVFGCGGDRDREKRPIMGRIAARLSDACFITSDNPRSEPVARINADILGGIGEAQNVTVEPDRARAIRRAVIGAGEGDVVALLGKGHESYQWIGDDKLPFSDREEAEAVLREVSA